MSIDFRNFVECCVMGYRHGRRRDHVTRPSSVAETTRQQQPAPRTSAPSARAGRSATRTSELRGRLREDLLAGALKPGEPLPLAMVRERYGPGLTPTRDAPFQPDAAGL